MRLLAASVLVVLVACNSAANSPRPPTGGTSAPTGGSGGSTPTGGAIAGGGTGGTVSIDAAAVATPIDASPDAPPMSLPGDGAAPGDATVATDGLPAGIPGHEWVIPCDPSWPKAQCCAHYCGCMAKNCADREPKDCMATCTAPGNNWNLKCKVEQCFESLDPRFPMDHGSHCGHATEAAHCQGIIP